MSEQPDAQPEQAGSAAVPRPPAWPAAQPPVNPYAGPAAPPPPAAAPPPPPQQPYAAPPPPPQGPYQQQPHHQQEHPRQPYHHGGAAQQQGPYPQQVSPQPYPYQQQPAAPRPERNVALLVIGILLVTIGGFLVLGRLVSLLLTGLPVMTGQNGPGMLGQFLGGTAFWVLVLAGGILMIVKSKRRQR